MRHMVKSIALAWRDVSLINLSEHVIRTKGRQPINSVPPPAATSSALRIGTISHAGMYFVTICAQNRKCGFGNVVNGKVSTAKAQTRNIPVPHRRYHD